MKATDLTKAMDKPQTKITGAATSSLESLLKQDSIKKRFEEMLGKKAAGFMSSIISATSTNPNLKACDPMTVISSAAVAASLDLPINPSLGFAYIVPYSGRAQFQMGWRAYVQLAMRTGQYQRLNAVAVYEGELIRNNRFTGDMEFDETKQKSTKIVGYVAYMRLLNGFEKYLYMTKEAVEAHGRRYSKSFGSDNGRWKLDFDAMALKTVLKMLLSKYGILSIEMQKALIVDQAVLSEDGKVAEYVDNPEGNSAPVDGEIVPPLEDIDNPEVGN